MHRLSYTPNEVSSSSDEYELRITNKFPLYDQLICIPQKAARREIFLEPAKTPVGCHVKGEGAQVEVFKTLAPSPFDHFIKEQVDRPVILILIIVTYVEGQDHPGIDDEYNDAAEHLIFDICAKEEYFVGKDILKLLQFAQRVGGCDIVAHAQIMFQDLVETGIIVGDHHSHAFTYRLLGRAAGIAVEGRQWFGGTEGNNCRDFPLEVFKAILHEREIEILVRVSIVYERRLREHDLFIALCLEILNRMFDHQVYGMNTKFILEYEAAV